MGVRSIVKALVKGSYNTGRTLTDRFGGNSASDRKTAAVVDVIAGLAATYFFGASALSWITAAVYAVTLATTATVAIPAAILPVAGAVLFGTMGIMGVAMGIGFLNAANNKLNIVPQKTVDDITNATRTTVKTVSRPFKAAGAKLSQSFAKANDNEKPKKAPKRKAAAKPVQVQPQ